MERERASGILLHPTSLPGPYPIGDLGSAGYAFVDFLQDTGQSLWQILPLGPTGYGNSPYSALSAFAGNPILISLDQLVEMGLLEPGERDEALHQSDRVDYAAAWQLKQPRLQTAFDRFEADASEELHQKLDEFRVQQKFWLGDFALFMALGETSGKPWPEWDSEIRLREPDALERWRDRLSDRVRYHEFVQFIFFRQWLALKQYANERGIRIIGDMPIFVAYDSSDVWAHQKIFEIDEDGRPIHVAGVPPDFFSETGQLWGNPVYRWDVLAQTGYQWWIERFAVALTLVDILRIDHFRGFAAYWSVPAGEPTAVKGEWVPGPGKMLFDAVDRTLGHIPLIVEDLGLITPDVEELRDELGYPGMKVLQFAFGSGPGNPYLPHNYIRNCVVYTGTHDNDTTIGWFATCSDEERTMVQRYLGVDGHDIAWDLIRAASMSVANLAIIPLQDVLSLGSEARMNVPGLAHGNWEWRLQEGQLTEPIKHRLADLTWLFGRAPQERPSEQRLT